MTRRKRMHAGAVSMVGVMIACSGLTIAAERDGALPISNITLYRSGVGYFERRGLIEDNADVQIRFNTDQINDILKSMVLLDLDGGMIEAASYGSKEPLARRLASFAVDISDNPDMGELLNRLRGARVGVRTIEGESAGVVVGVEQRPVPTGDVVVTRPFVNLLTDAGIQSIDLAGITGMRILDEQLASELSKALAALAEHRADNTKSVDLSFRGEGARRIVVAYVHEMPVWKTSYRLVLPDDSGGEPTLQGWAIVENTTDEDWNDVALSLVAGQPVGFQMDLYQPLFLTRPQVPVPVTAGVSPRAYEGEAVDWSREEALARLAPGAPMEDAARDRGIESRSRRSAGRGVGAALETKTITADDMAMYAARAQASAAEVGEVFQYKLDQPVTIERRRSAMLPILSAAIEGERVSIFNLADGLEHPMRGVDMTNTSGLQLMPGPISVFDGAAYAGDAQIGHISAGEERLLAYAVDLEVLVNTEQRNETNMVSLRIVNGLIEETRRSRQQTRYVFKNNDKDEGRTIIVEHAKQGGWELVAPEKPAKETNTAYRFQVNVNKDSSGVLEVVLERTDRQTIGITSYNLQNLLRYSREGKASEQVVAAVREAIRLQQRVNEVDEQIHRIEQERSEIANDQARVRENMARIDRNTDLYARYIQKLGEQETRLEQIVEELDALRTERQKRQDEFNAYLRNLNVR
ncbi:MAG: DUF4139 domain-containing protein [Planctomycetota bacterium]|nr:MAG: DUF4139 domain-containing protein [Planctomycetota bacterium]